MPEKKAAYSQNCLRVHLSNLLSWHWAHSSLTPRNSRDVAAARFSGLSWLPWKKAMAVMPPAGTTACCCIAGFWTTLVVSSSRTISS